VTFTPAIFDDGGRQWKCHNIPKILRDLE